MNFRFHYIEIELENPISDPANIINTLNTACEYICGNGNIKFLIINNFKINTLKFKGLWEFIQTCLFKQLRRSGVLKVFIITTNYNIKNSIQNYVKSEFVSVFSSISDVHNWIYCKGHKGLVK